MYLLKWLWGIQYVHFPCQNKVVSNYHSSWLKNTNCDNKQKQGKLISISSPVISIMQIMELRVPRLHWILLFSTIIRIKIEFSKRANFKSMLGFRKFKETWKYHSALYCVKNQMAAELFMKSFRFQVRYLSFKYYSITKY